MIAYNLCYSTCLGSIKELFKTGKTKKIGVTEDMSLHLDQISEIIEKHSQEEALEILSNYIFISPNRVAFVKKNLKEGFIPKMLLEFLISRIMIKNSSQLYKKESIKTLLKERQIALKLFMNVTFGYTGASFSGRMPCSEIADSVVEISKYCLRKSIDHLNNHPVYKGKVLYGDTDSIFFHMPCYSMKNVFEIGKQLADEITKLFPYPMEMKFEKVYESLFLVSKKRYYGKSYESAESKPKYEGKGIETVRRDGIEFTSRVIGDILNKLIDSRDLSLIKQLFEWNAGLLLNGEVSELDICLAKEVKLLRYEDKTCPAHGEAAKRMESMDPMLVPKYGERMKYVVLEGKQAIKRRSLPLFEYMKQNNKKKFKLDYLYYFERLFLPPLRRTLISLINIDQWGLTASSIISKQDKSNHHSPNYDICSHSNLKSTQIIACDKCLDQLHQELIQDTRLSIDICHTCTASKTFDIQSCVEWNCTNLYQRIKDVEKQNRGKIKIQEILDMKKYISTIFN